MTMDCPLYPTFDELLAQQKADESKDGKHCSTCGTATIFIYVESEREGGWCPACQRFAPKTFHGKGTLFIGGKAVGLMTSFKANDLADLNQPAFDLGAPHEYSISGKMTAKCRVEFFRVFRPPWWKLPYHWVHGIWWRFRLCWACAGSGMRPGTYSCMFCKGTGRATLREAIHRWVARKRLEFLNNMAHWNMPT